MEKEVKAHARDISIDGIRTRVELSGSGSPLLLIHGLGGPLIWQRVTGLLSQSFRVANLHLPGFGESECARNPYSTRDYTRFVLRVLKELPCEYPTIVGTSYGGEIGLHLGLDDDAQVNKLVLINPTGFHKHSASLSRLLEWSLLRRFAARIILNRRLACHLGRLSFYDLSKRPNDLCLEFNRQIIKKGKPEAFLNVVQNVVMGSGDPWELLGKTRRPLLMIWASDDRILPLPRESDRAQGSLITTKIFPKCGHSLPLEKPAELCELIEAFTRDPL